MYKAVLGLSLLASMTSSSSSRTIQATMRPQTAFACRPCCTSRSLGQRRRNDFFMGSNLKPARKCTRQQLQYNVHPSSPSISTVLPARVSATFPEKVVLSGRFFAESKSFVLQASSAVQDPDPSSETDNNSTQTVGGAIRSKLRAATGFSLTKIRATLRAATGFSMTSLRATLRAATGVSISAILKRFVGLFPLWARSFFQPFLILYYWPIFVMRGLLGFNKTYKPDLRKSHETLIEGWTKAVESATKANEDGYWPVVVNEEGQIQLVPPPSIDKDELEDPQEVAKEISKEASDVATPVEDPVAAGVEVSLQEVLEKEEKVEEPDVLTSPATDAMEEKLEEDTAPSAAVVEESEEENVSSTTLEKDAESKTIVDKEDDVPSSAPVEAEVSSVATEIAPPPTESTEDKQEPATEMQPTEESTEIPTSKTQALDSTMPQGPRWAIASPNTDLSGKWYLQSSEAFKSEYDKYLEALGQPAIVRAVAISIVGLTREETRQEDQGRKLTILGLNPRGIWERTYLSSGTDVGVSEYQPINVSIATADDEMVDAEAWWEEGGTLHKSWMRGLEKYGGGDFESSRFLESENVLVCQSVFHPRDKERKKAGVTWRFQREGTS